MVAALAKLKWLVVVENVETETAQFWKAPKDYGDAGRSKIQTEVFLLPAGDLRREGRHVHELGALDAVEVEGARSARPGEGRPGDPRPRSCSRCRSSTRRKAASLPEPVLNVSWTLHEPRQPRPRRGPEGDQRQGPRRHPRPQGQDEGPEDGRPAARRLRPAPGRRLDDVRQLAALGRLHRSRATRRSGATTPTRPASACSTSGRSRGPRTAASCTTAPPPTRTASPGTRRAPGIKWNGEKWVGDVPDMKPDAPPGDVRRVHHAARGRRPALRAGPQRRPVPRALRGRSKRPSTTRSTRRSRRTRRARSSRRTRTSTRRRRSTRSSARRTGSPSTSTTGRSTTRG